MHIRMSENDERHDSYAFKTMQNENNETHVHFRMSEHENNEMYVHFGMSENENNAQEHIGRQNEEWGDGAELEFAQRVGVCDMIRTYTHKCTL